MTPDFKPYFIPVAPIETTLEVKKSRFIARASHTENREAAMAFLAQAKLDYPDARHHCWAYLIGNPASASTAAMNDAGEPSGTAGKPILNVIQHKGIGDVMVVVIRYFGGIKLGAGGLTRAYSSATEMALSAIVLKEQVPTLDYVLCLGFSQEQSVRHWAGQNEASIDAITYSDKVTLSLNLPQRTENKLLAFCAANGIVAKIITDLSD